ncbi:MAG: BTAD domain-containing putative transcriptional regulator [Sedimentitalea sp.]|uniref:BTAD domain-containing putative transcriptional regulator n=1 Tax=Sedimentitalea sp. TaxID=2048915 RepID=UPI0032660390
MTEETSNNQLQILDRFRWGLGGQDTRLSANSRRLIAILALNQNLTETRKRVASLLWDRADRSTALRNLRQAVYECRKELGPLAGCLIPEDDKIALGQGVAVDIVEIREQLSLGNVPEKLFSSRSISERIVDVLPSGNPVYESWVQLNAQEWETRFVSSLSALLQGPDQVARLRAAEVLISLDPSHELAARTLIASHAAGGNVGTALSIYSRIWQYLDEEYGMEPSLETQNLIAQVKTSDGDLPGPSSVAVLPTQGKCAICVTAIKGEATDSLAYRIAELFRTELIACLSSFREFDIFDGRFHSGKADYTLSCTTLADQSHVNVTLHLTQMADGSVVIGHRLGDIAANWFRQKNDMTGQIAAACSAAISRKRLERMTREPSHSQVVDLWIKGQTKLHQFRPDTWQEACRLYENCIRLDPDFSPAHSALAQLMNSRQLAMPGIVPEHAFLMDAVDHANRAISLDPEDSRAHLARAWSHCLLHNTSQAMCSFDMALKCNPNDLWAILSAALGAAFCDEADQARQLAQHCQSDAWNLLPPHWGYLATIDFVLGNYTGCVANADLAGKAIINIPAWKAAALIVLDRPIEAAQEWKAFENFARAAWVPDSPPSADAIANWLLACFPISNPQQAEHFRRCVSLARAALHDADQLQRNQAH